MFHRSERLLLRPTWPEDWEAVLYGIADAGVMMNLARAPWPYGPDEARAFVARLQDERFPDFLIVQSATGQTVGCAGLGEGRHGAELGYWVARRFWGQGYATEAARGVLRIARMIGHRHLEAGHFTDNPASGNVLRKLGFVPTGVVRPRHSRARGREVDAAEYELSLDSTVTSPAMRVG